jgi:hypothetical protein
MKTWERPPLMSMAADLEALTKTRECPPPMSKTSMMGPLGGADENPGAPTTYVEDVDGRPLGGHVSVRVLRFEDTWCLRSPSLGAGR